MFERAVVRENLKSNIHTHTERYKEIRKENQRRKMSVCEGNPVLLNANRCVEHSPKD